MKFLIALAALLLSACAAAPDRCDRTTVANACYWTRGGEPNAAGNGPSSGAAARGGRSATSGGMGHGRG
jgi:starvation-inducible outer membrane lipoprotein